jgi:hypothetical protein
MQHAPPVQQSAAREVALAVLTRAVAARINIRYFIRILLLPFPFFLARDASEPTRIKRSRDAAVAQGDAHAGWRQ